MAAIEFQNWKLARICKDADDIMACENVILKYYKQLKHIFISLISDDMYPMIGMLQISDFCKDCEIIDQACPSNVIDRAFIASNYSADVKKNESNSNLQRFEFFEILVRIADAKFRQTKQVSTFAEALEMLLHHNVFKNY